MSRSSKLTFSLTCLVTASIVTFVHWAQTSEKAAMHAGVVRDIENQRVKKERQADFALQAQLEEEYRKMQSVSDGTGREGVRS